MPRHADRHPGGADDHRRQQDKVYGAALPALTASYSGLRQRRHRRQPDHAAEVTTTATAASPAGAIRSPPAAPARAELHHQLCAGTLTVTPAALTITAATEQGLRRGAAGADGQLQRLRQRRHGRQPDHAAGLTTTATAASPVGHLSDHGQRRGRRELHHQLCRRHADGHPGGADDHRRQQDQGLRRGAAGPDGQLQRLRQRRHGGQPDHASRRLTTTATAASPVGTYPITASGAADAELHHQLRRTAR